jgi:endonuclease/exonuclease/phosphatase family metal-dependent hydrolase
MLIQSKLFFVITALLGFCAFSTAKAESDKRVVKVMTRNMDAGTDMGYMFYFINQGDYVTGTALTMQELNASRIPERAVRLADEIAEEQPYLVSLQEVTLWRTGASVEDANEVLYDQLRLLQDALAARHQHYAVVAVQDLTDLAMPMSATSALRFTDRDAILARTDLRHSEFDLSNAQTHRYENSYVPFPGLPVLRGWMSVDAKVRGKSFRYVNTHLESTSIYDPRPALIQVAQAGELIQALRASRLPVIIGGDFNSNAEPGPEQTDTVADILKAGFIDTWDVEHRHMPGYTWPLFPEDSVSGEAMLSERIDLIFSRGLEVQRVHRIGEVPNPYASDHLGVVATLELEH